MAKGNIIVSIDTISLRSSYLTILNASRKEKKTYFKHSSFATTAVIQVFGASPLFLTATSSRHKNQTDTDNLHDAETMTPISKTQLARAHEEPHNPNTFLRSKRFTLTEVFGKSG